MVNPLAGINQARYRQGVTTMLPPALVPRPPVQRPAPSNARGGSLADRIYRQQEETGWAPQGGGGGAPNPALRGLGWVVGNPVSKAAFGALSVFDYPRSAVNATLRETLDALNVAEGGEDTGFDLGELWRNTKAHKGFGELIVEPALGDDANIWLKRGLGLAGDIATDPFSWATLGTKAIPGAAARSSYAAKLMGEQGRLGGEIASHAGKVAEMEKFLPMAELIHPETAAATRAALEASQQALPDLLARQEMLGGSEALERIGRRGVGSANPAQLAAMGVDRPALRVGSFLGMGKGVEVPHTEAMARFMGRATGPVREAFGKSALASGVRKLRTPEGQLEQDLAEATNRILTGRGGGTIEEALGTTRFNDLLRVGHGRYKGMAVHELDNWWEKVKQLSPDERARLIREGEELGSENAMTELAPRMISAAKQMGVELPTMEGHYVMPHIFSREAFRFLQQLKRNGDSLYEPFKTAIGFSTRDLLKEGSFVQKRLLRPTRDAQGVLQPLELKIGDQVIRIEKGSIAELEQKLGGLLRSKGFKGNLYESNPYQAWKQYITSQSRDVAIRYAGPQAQREGLQGLGRAGYAPESFDPYGGRKLMPTDAEGNPITAADQEGARQRVTAIPESQRPQETEFWQLSPDDAATAKRNKELSKQGATGKEQLAIAKELETGADAARVAAAKDINASTEEAWKPITEALQGFHEGEQAAAGRAEMFGDLAEELKTRQADIDRMMAESQDEIDRLRREMASTTSGGSRRARRRMDQLTATRQTRIDKAETALRDLQDAYDTLQRVNRETAETAFADAARFSVEERANHLTLLERRAKEAKDRFDLAQDELIGQAATGKGQRGSRWVSSSEKRQAERIVNNPEVRERHNRLVRRAQQLEREETKLRAEAAGMDAEATQLRYRANSRDISEAEQRKLVEQADRLEGYALNKKYQAIEALKQRAQGDNPQNLAYQVKNTAYAKAKRTLDLDKENRAALDRATIEAHDEIPMSRAAEAQDIEQAVRTGRRQKANTLPSLRNIARETMEERDAFRAALTIEEQMPKRARTVGEAVQQRGDEALEKLKTPTMEEARQLQSNLDETEAAIRQTRREGPANVYGGEKLTWSKNADGTQTATVPNSGRKSAPPFGGSADAAAATILEREVREEEAGFFSGFHSYLATSEPRDDITTFLNELRQPPNTNVSAVPAGPDLQATITQKVDGWHVTWEGGVPLEGGGRRAPSGARGGAREVIADTEEEAKAFVEAASRPLNPEARDHASKMAELLRQRDELRQQIEARPIRDESYRREKTALGRAGDRQNAVQDLAAAERVLSGPDEQAYIAMRDAAKPEGPAPPPPRRTEMGLEVKLGDDDLKWTKQPVPAEEAAADTAEYDSVAAQLRQAERDLRVANEPAPRGGGRTAPPDERSYSSSVRKKAFDPETGEYKPKSAQFAGKETKQATEPWWSEEQYLTSSPALNIDDPKKAAEIEARNVQRLGREPRVPVVQKPFPSRSIENAFEPPIQRPPEPFVERPSFPRENPGEKPVRYRLTAPDGTSLHTIEATRGGWNVIDPEGNVTFHKLLVDAKRDAAGAYRRNAIESAPELAEWRAHIDDLTAKRNELKEWLDQNAHLKARSTTSAPSRYVVQVGKDTVQIERAASNKFNVMFPDGRVVSVSAKRPYEAMREANQVIRERAGIAIPDAAVSTVDTEAAARIAAYEAANPKVVARVRQAEDRAKRANLKLRELDQPLPPSRIEHPKIEEINRETSQQLDQALDLERNAIRTEAEFQPKFAAAEDRTLRALDDMESIESGQLGDTAADVRQAMDRLDSDEVRVFRENQEKLAAIDKKLQRPKPKRQDRRYRERIEALRMQADELSGYFEQNADLAAQVRADENRIARGVEGTRGPSHAGIALEEASNAMPKIATARREVEGQQEFQRQLIEQRQAIDPELAQMQEYFYDSLYDQADMKAAHNELKAKVAPLKRRDAEAILTKKAAGRPTKVGLGLVEGGSKSSYEVQPLHTVMEDMDALIALDPLGNDEQIRKATAAVSATEKALGKITQEGDLPAYQARNIVDEANKGKLAPVVMAQLRDGWSFLWDGGDIVISDAMRSKYLNIQSTVESKRFGPLLTAFTDFFKTYATLTPGFHVRNGMSAIFMNASEGVTVREQFQGLKYWKQFIKAEDPQAWMADQPQHIQDAFSAVFSSGTGGQFTEAGVSELRTGGRRLTEKLYSNKLTKANQRFGQNYVEGPARLALAMNTTRQQGASVVDAMNRISRVHFDYSQISKFDAQMKRFIPFWTFMSRNLPLQVTQMWTKPGTYLRFQSFLRNATLGAEELPWMPEYIKHLGGFSTGGTVPGGVPGTEEGSPLVWMPPFPQYQVQEDLRRAASALSGENIGQMFSDVNPAFTTPFEFMTGTDIYTGKRYGPEDWSKVNAAGMPLAAAMMPFGLAKRGGDGNVYMQDKAMQALMSVNPIMERQSRLIPNLMVESPAKSNRQMESYLRFLGVPLRTLTQDQMRSEQTGRYYDRRDKALERAATGG